MQLTTKNPQVLTQFLNLKSKTCLKLATIQQYSFFLLSYLLPRVTGRKSSKVIILQVQVQAVPCYVSVPQASLDQACQEASEHHPEPLAILIESEAAFSRKTPEGGDWTTTCHLKVLVAPYDDERLFCRKFSLVCSFS